MAIRRLSLLVLLFCHLLLLFGLRYTVWPEMVLYPYFLMHGYKLYSEIINPYFPLLPYLEVWFFSLTGLSILTIKILTIIFILACDATVFTFCLKLSKSYSRALLALSFYIILQVSFGGNALWFELALTPFLLFSLYLLYFFKDRRNLILSGFLLAVAVLIKQNAVLFLIPVSLLLYQQRRLKEVVYFILPGLLLSLFLFIWLAVNKLGADFFNLAVKLPLTFSHQPGFLLFPSSREWLLILTLFLPIIFAWKNLKYRVFWLLITLVSLSFALQRYEDFHLQILIAVGAILISLADKSSSLIMGAVALLIFSRAAKQNFRIPDRFIDQETLGLSQKIKQYPSVYLLNAPELSYFFAGKFPPKPWATNFPWNFEGTDIGERMITNMEDNQTVIVEGQRSGGSQFTLGNYIPSDIDQFINDNYQVEDHFGGFEIWKRKSR
jgi:hypothetical protein